ncbi:MAG: aldo/keto reductase [Acidimicrobiales bacterium]
MSLPTRRIGSLEVSVVGLGCNNFGGRIDERQTRDVVSAALDAGITLFDTADIYGGTKSEQFLGKALGSRRNDIVLATKFGMPVDAERKGAAPGYVRQALEDSLRRLGTDHVDLYQLHAPDPTTPIGDTLGVLDELVAAGKIREIGCSNFTTEQLEEARQVATSKGAVPFVSVQNEYSILHRRPELDVLDFCTRSGTAFIPYYPLARGLLTGKYRRGQKAPEGTRLATYDDAQYGKFATDENLAVVEQLEALASRHDRSVVELAIAWLAARPAVASVIAGATSPAQVAANARAATWELDAATAGEVDALVAPGSVRV